MLEIDIGNTKKEEIPLFIKNMGHQILCFILNIDEAKAHDVIEGQFELDAERIKIFNSFIQKCRQLRRQGLDQGSVDAYFYLTLPHLLQNGRHIFNIWNEQLGGKQADIESDDPVVVSASKIGPILLTV